MMKNLYTTLLTVCCTVFFATAQYSPTQLAAKDADKQAALAAMANIPSSQPMGGPCSGLLNTQMFEQFENGQPADWTFTVSDGGAWSFDMNDNGITTPGSNWAVVNDDDNDDIGVAVATSPVFDANGGDIEVSFSYDFQAFSAIGSFYVEFWDGTDWQFVNDANAFSTTSTTFCDDDCSGVISLTADAGTFGNSDFQFRLTYDDEGDFGWGFGFDDARLCSTAPVNDLCSNALTVACSDIVTGSTVDATATGASDCQNVGLGVWYAFVGTGDIVTFDLSNSAFDTYISVTESCGGVCFADDDDGGSGLTSLVSFGSVVGQTYYIQISGYNSTGAGAYEMEVTCEPAAANNLCAGATDMVCGDVVSGDFSVGTTADNGETSCSNGVGPGLWYHFVGNGQDVTASTCGSNADTEVTVYSGDCNTLACVGNNDDDCSNQSTVDFFAVAGTDYYINVAYWSTSSVPTVGDFDLSITCNCTADAGTLTAVTASPVCTSAGSVVLSATHDGNSVVPTGYVQAYVLTDATTGVILDLAATPDFTVTIGGDYTIHTAVYDPLQVDPFSLPPGTTGADVDALLIQGGGTMCGALDLTGVSFTVNEEGVSAAFTSSAIFLDVDFTDASTSSATITDWAWDFDDAGATSTDQNPSHSFTAEATYNVCLTVTDSLGCTSTVCEDVAVTDNVTSIAEAVENGMEVYPNPSNGQFVVKVSGVESDVEIVVMDVAGRKVYSENATLNNSFRKELSLDVAKGTYLLQIVTGEGLVTRKIQIK